MQLTLQVSPLQLMPLAHELCPVQRTSQRCASPQSMPLRQALLPVHSTRHAWPEGHVSLGQDSLAHVMTHTLSTQLPPCAWHSLASHTSAGSMTGAPPLPPPVGVEPPLAPPWLEPPLGFDPPTLTVPPLGASVPPAPSPPAGDEEPPEASLPEPPELEPPALEPPELILPPCALPEVAPVPLSPPDPPALNGSPQAITETSSIRSQPTFMQISGTNEPRTRRVCDLSMSVRPRRV